MKKPLALVALGAALHLPAFAQAPAAQPADTTRRVATIDELRACMDGNDSTRQRHAALQERADKMAVEAKSVEAEIQQVNEEANKLRLDSNVSPMQRDRFERRQRAATARSEALQKTSAAFIADRDALNKDIESLSTKCNGISFRNEDLEVVRKERAAAGKK